MAAYPTSVPFRHEIDPLTRRRVDVSEAGTVRQVDLDEDTAYRIQITHPLITQAQLSTLLTFYTINKASQNTITLDGVDYDVIFASAYSRDRINGQYLTATVELVGTVS